MSDLKDHPLGQHITEFTDSLKKAISTLQKMEKNQPALKRLTKAVLFSHQKESKEIQLINILKDARQNMENLQSALFTPGKDFKVSPETIEQSFGQLAANTLKQLESTKMDERSSGALKDTFITLRDKTQAVKLAYAPDAKPQETLKVTTLKT